MRQTLRRFYYNLRGILTSFHNFWRMRKIIYNYRGYDFTHALIFLLFYLEDFARHQNNFYWHKNNEVDLLWSHIRALQVVIKENYCEELWKDHDKRWGRLLHRLGKREKDGTRQFILYRKRARTPDKIEEERKERHNIMMEEHKRKTTALKQLGKLLRKDIYTFWC